MEDVDLHIGFCTFTLECSVLFLFLECSFMHLSTTKDENSTIESELEKELVRLTHGS